ncbi:hypothetical protein SBP02_11950 [Pseudomonas benzenivorans]|uniref:Uncharacterized protein n=1 Tax=Pseudomonas benzenivorans TaxID=556533 RepID=A0ABZ0PQR8_9PSED|nr:hypothetical protein [Pseudomonas benzenivorans]WPC03498.1 hypothetical protein SBP02_11950 [Pseudomonas benzenivorans]
MFNSTTNNIFNTARKALGEDTLNSLIIKTSEALADVKIEGRGNAREQLGLSSKNVGRVMKLARFKKVSTGIGAHNYRIMFPAGFVETLKQEILKAAMESYTKNPSREVAELFLDKSFLA